MKSFLALALLVGLALGSSTSYYGWKPNQQFRYKYTSELLTGIPDINFSQWSGVKLQSEIIVQTFSDYTVRLRIDNPKVLIFNKEDVHFVQDHPELPEATEDLPGWFKQELTKPFSAHMRRGVIETSFFESGENIESVNIKKAILSQLQMDLTGSGRGYLVGNDFVSGGKPATVTPLSSDENSYFSTLESTIDGECQTDYTFIPIPKPQAHSLHMVEETKERTLKQEGYYTEGRYPDSGEEICNGKQYYEVVKNRNYNNCVRRPVFQSSYGIHTGCDVSKGYCQDLLAHVSTTHYIICGDRDDFHIREIITDGQISTNPLGWNTTPEKMKQLVRVVMTVQEVKTSGFTPIPKPNSSEKRHTLAMEYPVGQKDAIPQPDIKSDEVIHPGNTSYIHAIRKLPSLRGESNFLPTFIKFNDFKPQMVEQLKEVVQSFFELSDSCSNKKDVSGRLGVMAYTLRPFSYQQVKQLESAIKSSQYKTEEQKKLAITLFYDILSMAGTNPCFMVVKDAISSSSNSLTVSDKTRIIMTSIRSTFTPTEELMREMLGLVKLQKQHQNKSIYTSGLISLTNLVYRACVDSITSITGYPVRIYGKFCTSQSSFLTTDLIPYLSNELNNVMSHTSQGEETVKLILIASLGKVGHKDALIPLTKVIESSQETLMTRSLAVSSLRRLARQEPTLVRRILLSLVDNPAEATEVRIAAVAVIPYTQPSVAELQKMAVRSWYEPSKQVGSFIHSTLTSLINTVNPELRNVGEKCKTLTNLVRPFQSGLQFSQHFQSNNYVRYLMTSASADFSYISGDNTTMPIRASVGSGLFGSSWNINSLTYTAYHHGFDTLIDKLVSNVLPYSKVSEESKSKLKELDEKLGLVKETMDKKIRGLFMIKSADLETIGTFENDASEIVQKLTEALKTPIGSHSSGTQHTSTAMLHSYINIEGYGPTETGMPIWVQRHMPIVTGMKVKTQTKSEFGKKTEVSTDFTPILNTKLIATLGVIMPSESRIVASGVEMSVHVALPVKTDFVLDSDNAKVELKASLIEPTSSSESNVEVFHYFVKPSTFIQSLTKLAPIGRTSESKTIFSGEQRIEFDKKIGKSIGIESTVSVKSDSKHFDLPSFINKIKQHNLYSLLTLGAMASSTRQNSIRYRLNIAESHTRSLETSFTIVNGIKKSEHSLPELKTPFSKESHLSSSSKQPWEKSLEEQKEELKVKCSKEHQLSYEIEKCLEKELKKCEGQKKTSEHLKKMLQKVKVGHGQGVCIETALVGSSASERKSIQAIIVSTKESKDSYTVKDDFTFILGASSASSQSSPVFTLKGEGVTKMPQMPFRWNVDRLIENDVVAEHTCTLRYGWGNTLSSSKDIKLQTTFTKEEIMKRELKQSQEYQKCQSEISSGRVLASVCEELRHQASSVNKVNLRMEIPQEISTSSVFVRFEEMIKNHLLLNMNVTARQERSSSGVYEISAYVNRHGDEAQITVLNPEYRVKFNDTRVPRVLIPFFPFSLRDPVVVRLLQKVTRDQSPASCRLNDNWVSTFDNKTYTYELEKAGCQVVLYKECEPSKPEGSTKPVSVVGKKNSGRGFQEIEFVNGKHIVLMTTSGSSSSSSSSYSSSRVSIKVNGQSVNLPVGQLWTCPEDGSLMLYRFSDEVVTAYNSELYAGVFFDGNHVEIMSPQIFQKNHACGLCGDNNGEYTTDVRTPKHCVMSSPRLGAYSYVLSDMSKCIPARDLQEYNREIKHCDKKEGKTTRVESLAKSLLQRVSQPGGLSVATLTHLVDELPNYLCISTRPVRTCPQGQTSTSTMKLDLQMSCMPRNWPSTQQLARRAQEGEILSEMAVFPATMTQRVYVPLKCSGGATPYGLHYRTGQREY